MHVQLPETTGELLAGEPQRPALAYKSDAVREIIGLDDVHRAPERASHAFDDLARVEMLPAEIDHDDPARREPPIAVIEETLTAQLRRLTGNVEPIDQQNIAIPGSRAQKMRPVLTNDAKTLIVRRHCECMAERDDPGIDLRNDDRRFRKLR